MTRDQLDSIESIGVFLVNGAALIYPPVAPIAAAIEKVVETAEEYGIIPTEMPAAQRAAIAAGMAAARASAVTSFKAHEGGARACRACHAPILDQNVAIADQCPCNSGRGINHGIVSREICTCKLCDPAQTGSSRVILKSSPIVAAGLGQR